MKKYTLIELLVAMGIFAFMMLLLMNFFGISTDLMTRENTRAEKLYEGGTFSLKLRQDLANIVTADATYNIDYDYSASEVKLRFFSDTWDNTGVRDAGEILAVSYVYSANDFTIKRYVRTTTMPGGFDTASPPYNYGAELETDTYGAVILEGVEDFQVLLYGNDGLATFDDADGTNDGETKVSGTFNAVAMHPDAMNFKVTLNNMSILENSSDGDNRRLGARRTISYQQLMGYKE